MRVRDIASEISRLLVLRTLTFGERTSNRCHMDRQAVRYQRDDQEFGRTIGFFDATYALALTLLVTTLDITEPSSAWAANESAKAPSAGLFSTTMSAEGRVFGRVDFGQREDQERNCDRDDAVAEDNGPFDICLSFMRHLLAQPFVRSTSSVGNGKVSESAKACATRMGSHRTHIAVAFAKLERDFGRSRTRGPGRSQGTGSRPPCGWAGKPQESRHCVGSDPVTGRKGSRRGWSNAWAPR